MSLKIKIEDWYNLHKGFQLTLEPGYTALVGPNGAGKTTILSQLCEFAEKEGIRFWEYSNLRDGGHVAANQYMFSGNIEGFAASTTYSEGEYLAYNFANQVKAMAQAVKQAGSAKQPILVLLDAIDSGASIDRARELMGFLNNVCETEFKNGVELYIVMAVNHYELAKAPANCINVRTGASIRFDSYDDYADFICTFEERYKRLPEKKIERKRP